jgi:hypothetical protein
MNSSSRSRLRLSISSTYIFRSQIDICQTIFHDLQQRHNHLGVLVGVSRKYFEDVERFELNAVAAIAKCVHDNLQIAISD